MCGDCVQSGVTPTPGDTPTAQSTFIAAMTQTAQPAVSGTPDGTATPDGTVTPDGTATGTPTATPEGGVIYDPLTCTVGYPDNGLACEQVNDHTVRFYATVYDRTVGGGDTYMYIDPVGYNRVVSVWLNVTATNSSRLPYDGIGTIGVGGQNPGALFIRTNNTSDAMHWIPYIDPPVVDGTVRWRYTPMGSYDLGDWNYGVSRSHWRLLVSFYYYDIYFSSNAEIYFSTEPILSDPSIPVSTPTPTPTPDSSYCASVDSDTSGEDITSIFSLPNVTVGETVCTGIQEIVIPLAWTGLFNDVYIPGVQVCLIPVYFGSMVAWGVVIDLDYMAYVIAGAMILRMILRS